MKYSEINEVKLTDYPSDAKTYLGNVAIWFRSSNNPGHDEIKYHAYILNSKHDGWFRKFEGNANGYGLMITEVGRVNNKNTWEFGNGRVYKIILKYNSDTTGDGEKIKADKFWLYVDKRFEVEDVVNYINKNKSKWTA